LAPRGPMRGGEPDLGLVAEQGRADPEGERVQWKRCKVQVRRRERLGDISEADARREG